MTRGVIAAIEVWKERRELRQSFGAFAEKFCFSKLPNRVPAPHHAVVCEAIQTLADDPEGGILIVLMPPGGGKTMIAARALSAWAMGRRPRDRVVMVTNTVGLAESHGRAIRETMQDAEYERTFNITISQQLAGASNFMSTGGGEFFAVGSTGAVLGKRAEWVILDDPVGSFAEAQSVTLMEKLHEAWRNNIMTRLVPGSKVILIQQRLSDNDLAGYLMRNQVEGGRKLRVLRLPMLCDDPANDPLGRKKGEPLWADYWTRGDIIDAQADAYKWATLYQQSPPSDINAWCDLENVQTTPLPPLEVIKHTDEWRVMIGIDVASSVNRGDATVFVVVAIKHRGNDAGAIHIMHIYREQTDHAESCEKLLDLVDNWHPLWVGIDNDGGSQSFVSHLKTRAVGRGVPLGRLEQLPIRGQNKEARAGALRAKIQSKMLHVDRAQPWAKDVLRELSQFPNAMGSAVDDIVDALSLIARKTSMMMISAPRPPEETKPVDPRGTFFSATLDDLHEANRPPGAFGKGRI